MKHIVFCVLSAVLTAIITPTSWAVTYAYIGNTGGNIGDQTPPAGTYTSGTRITASFELASELAPSLPPTPIGASALSYSISDGRTTLTNTNSNIDFFQVGTDAYGNIVNWVIDISTRFSSPVAVGDQYFSISTRFNTDAANINQCVAISPATGFCSDLDIDTYRIAFKPGVWTRGPTSSQASWFEYAAKIVCGIQKDPADMALATGLYATAINIRNAGLKKIEFTKTLVLTVPPGGQLPGQVRPVARDTLEAGQALETDCNDVLKRVSGGKLPGRYMKGFVVLKSPAPLNVTAVYTVGALKATDSAASSIDVENIPERAIPAPGK